MKLQYNDLDGQIEKELLINGTVVVILKRKENKGNETNLFGFEPFGEELWRKEPPIEETDSYVNFWIEENKLWVGSWSGFSIKINPRTGETLETLFTK